MNVQWAVRGAKVFIIEANPRASRTVPFVSKAIGQPLAKMAARIMLGETIKDVGVIERLEPPFFSVKALRLGVRQGNGRRWQHTAARWQGVRVGS